MHVGFCWISTLDENPVAIQRTNGSFSLSLVVVAVEATCRRTAAPCLHAPCLASHIPYPTIAEKTVGLQQLRAVL